MVPTKNGVEEKHSDGVLYEQRRSEEVRSNVVLVYLPVFCELPDERVIIFAAIYIHPASAAPAVKPYQKPGFFVVTLVRRTSESM
jgi:hypothetical protein